MKLAEDRGCQLSDLSTHDLQTINKLFEDDVQKVWNYNRYAHCCQGTMIASVTVKFVTKSRAGLEHWYRRQKYCAAFNPATGPPQTCQIHLGAYLVLRKLSFNLLVAPCSVVDAAASLYHIWQVGCRSAEMRDTEGGASKRSVLQQVEKLKTYLSAESI